MSNNKENQRRTDFLSVLKRGEHRKLILLIESLLDGSLKACDFRLVVSQYSPKTATTLFRDMLPRFSSDLKKKLGIIFERFFFCNSKKNVKTLWKLVNHSTFWTDLKNFHDYSTKNIIDYGDIKSFLSQAYNNCTYKRPLTYVQRKLVESLEKSPTLTYSKISEEIQVSKKKLSFEVKNLRNRGIFLGSFIDYRSLGFFEYFTFNEALKGIDSILLKKTYTLFPNFILNQFVCNKLPKDTCYYAIDKKVVISNSVLLSNNINFDQCKSGLRLNPPGRITFSENQDIVCNLNVDKPYGLDLVENCKIDFRHPDFQSIASRYDVSIRTLIRMKKMLIKNKVVQPHISIKDKSLSKIVFLSQQEIPFLYNKLPYIEAYKLNSGNNESLWLSMALILPHDIGPLHNFFRKKSEMFIVTEEKVSKISAIDGISYNNYHKTYTK